MDRLRDHFCFSPDLLPLRSAAEATATPLPATGASTVQASTLHGKPLYFHVPQQTSTAMLRTDDARTFDEDDAIACIQLEHYVSLDPPSAEKGMRTIYYRLKPILPRSAQLWMQRMNARKRLRNVAFPRWPHDDTLQDLFSVCLAARMRAAGVDRLPFIGFWPAGYTWACCLTHDVDTGFGYRNIFLMERIEEACQRQSSWYIVPERYPWEPAVLDELRNKGHEVGVHGVDHSGKLFDSRHEFEWRRDKINGYLRSWNAVGFRSPATYRHPEWLTELDCRYDSSYMDVATLEPQRGGVCAPFPFLLADDMVELPITLPMDHTLINVLRQDVFEACRSKIEWIRAQNGLALALFHPDYNTTPRSLDRYRRVVVEMGDHADAWFVLPHVIADWWQRRRRSRIVAGERGPRIEGPAAADGCLWWAHLQGERVAYEVPQAEAARAVG